MVYDKLDPAQNEVLPNMLEGTEGADPCVNVIVAGELVPQAFWAVTVMLPALEPAVT
jgi:hypothetical protein